MSNGTRVAMGAALMIVCLYERAEAQAPVWNWARITIDHVVVETHLDGPQVGVRFNDNWNPHNCPNSALYSAISLNDPLGRTMYAHILQAKIRGAGIARKVEGCTSFGWPLITGVSD